MTAENGPGPDPAKGRPAAQADQPQARAGGLKPRLAQGAMQGVVKRIGPKGPGALRPGMGKPGAGGPRVGPGGGQGPRRPGGPGPAANPATDSEDNTPVTRPLAEPAKMKPRHRGLIYSFLVLVCLPVLLSTFYLFVFAEDQYASTVGFTVRREENTSASSLLGGLSQLAGSGGSMETDILYEYIQSQEIVTAIDERIGLAAIYSTYWPRDPVFSLWTDPSTEDLRDHWSRMVRISYDSASQLIELRVMAFTADDAQRIAQEILAESQKMINTLNQRAREDIMRYATEDVEKTVIRLKAAREALSRFRTSTQIVDPAADIQGRMGVLNNLQQQLAEALIEYDIVIGTTQDSDPRREQAARRISVIRDRIAAERQTFATEEGGAAGENYPEIIAEFENLTVDLQFAEETYRAALAAQDAARDQAVRQTVYLAAYINPTWPQTAEYPQRFVLTFFIGLFLTLGWTIGALIFYAVRDRQ